MIPKHATQTRILKISGWWLWPNTSINRVPDNSAAEMARKRTPNALLTSTVSASLFKYF
jgi:hypothetical protein